jgi:hypothetical protein
MHIYNHESTHLRLSPTHFATPKRTGRPTRIFLDLEDFPTIMQRQDEEDLELSTEALAALAEFAVEVRGWMGLINPPIGQSIPFALRAARLPSPPTHDPPNPTHHPLDRSVA